VAAALAVNIASLLLIYFMMRRVGEDDLIRDENGGPLTKEISWNEFVNDYLKKGEVSAVWFSNC